MQPAFSIGRYLILLLVCAWCVRASAQTTDREPQSVTFQSGDNTLNGYLWVPKGNGPFRALVWNYGHGEPLLKQGPPSKFNQLAELYLGNKYVLFVPDRSSAGMVAVQGKKQRKPDFGGGETDDIIAAISWLRQQSFVDASKVAVSGMMSGSIHSMLAIERDATIRAAVLFSPASQSWKSNPEVQTMLERAVDSTPVPMFLIQPQNDTDLGPSEVLGRKLARKGGSNRAKIYPPIADPKSFAVGGVRVWGDDVLKFLDMTMK